MNQRWQLLLAGLFVTVVGGVTGFIIVAGNGRLSVRHLTPVLMFIVVATLIVAVIKN